VSVALLVEIEPFVAGPSRPVGVVDDVLVVRFAVEPPDAEWRTSPTVAMKKARCHVVTVGQGRDGPLASALDRPGDI
jgi:hypothetical protein